MKKNQLKLMIISSAVTLCLLFSTLGTVNAIINGQPDEENHPYVCVIAVGYPGPGPPYDVLWSGTGILIAPNIVLTAGHIVDTPPGAQISVHFETDARLLDPFGGISGVGYPHPEYSIGRSPTLKDWISHDVGVIVLDEPVYLSEYGELPDEGLVDSLPMKSMVDLVGYGYQNQIKGDKGPPYWDFFSALVRTHVPAQLITSKNTWSDEFIKTTQNPSKDKGGFTLGDSGGPVLLEGTNTIIGVISWGTNYNAKGVGYSSRVDKADVLEFIGIVGYTTTPIWRHYREESAMGDWVTDIMRDSDSSIDFAFHQATGFRSDIDAGDIYGFEIFQVLPFDNTLVLCSMTGTEVISALEDGVKGPGGVIEVSGLSFTFDWGLALGSRVSNVIDLSTGLSIVPSKTYIVAVNSFIAYGPLGYDTIASVPQVDTGVMVRELVIDWTIANSPFSPPDPGVEQRISILGTPPL